MYISHIYCPEQVEDEDLVLSSFTALHHCKGEPERFYELLTNITLVTTPDDASLFLLVYNLLNGFRQSIERLLEVSSAEKCVASCKAMAAHCLVSPTARALLRNIKIDDYISELLLTHPNEIHPDWLITIITQCLKLIIALCSDTDQLSQALFADRLETVFLPMLRGGPAEGDPPLAAEEREQIMKLTARMIPHLFVGNRALSIAFSNVLTQAVVDQMRASGKSSDLLRILKTLIVVDGKSVEVAQTSVSKGVGENSGGMDGNLMVDEWKPGPAMSFQQVIENALTNPSVDGDEPTRQEMAMEYTNLLMDTVGMCARGLMPHTELRAASMLPFDQCMDRLLGLYQEEALAEFQNDDKLTSVKRCTLQYLNDVFIDSDSEFTQALVKQRTNGLWTMPPRDAEMGAAALYTPLGQVLASDIKRLDRSSSAAFRSYVINEVMDFFVLYCVSAPRSETLEEDDEELVSDGKRLDQQSKLEAIAEAGSASQELLERMSSGAQALSEEELIVSQHLISVVDDWMAGSELLPPHHLESFRRAGGGNRDRKPPKQTDSEVDTMWKCFVQEYEKVVVGASGFLAVAKDLDLEVPGSDDKYSRSLLVATRTRIQNRVKQTDYKMAHEESRLLCSVLDVIRAIPYVVHGQEAKLKDAKVHELYEAMDMNIFLSPSVSVSESQIQICAEGWGLLCWNILAEDRFASVHLAAVRLLQTMLGGGNFDVQTTILNDLTDKTKCERELLGSSCRRLFRAATDELRSIRKKKRSHVDNDILIVTFHVLIVLTCSCQHAHRGMQDYIPYQYGHQETRLLVPDIYEFTVEVEREVKYAMENDAVDTLHHETDGGSVYLLDVLELCFRLFSFLATGPNEANQLTIASSGVLLVVNRIHAYSLLTDKSELQDLDTVDPSPEFTEAHWQFPSLIKCRLNSYTKDLLLVLLEGTPDKAVVASICQSLDFNVYSTHMRTMKTICEDMTNSELKVSAAIRTSGWVRSQCFHLITTLEKLVASDLPRKAMLPLMPVLRQKPMMDWYRARLGQAEVVRKGQLESLYFEIPTDLLEPTVLAAMTDEMDHIMDEAFNSANSHEDRISSFVERVIQVGLSLPPSLSLSASLKWIHWNWLLLDNHSPINSKSLAGLHSTSGPLTKPIATCRRSLRGCSWSCASQMEGGT